MVMMIMIDMVMMKLIKMMRLEFGLVNTSNHLHVKGHKGHFRHFQKQWGITLSYKHRNISVFFLCKPDVDRMVFSTLPQ